MTKKFTVRIPVMCRNGHTMYWYKEIDGPNVISHGIPIKERCGCPMMQYQEGYQAIGEPEII